MKGARILPRRRLWNALGELALALSGALAIVFAAAIILFGVGP